MKALRRSQASLNPASLLSSSLPSSFSAPSWIHLRSALYIASSTYPATCSSADRTHLKSPWSQRKRKPSLSPRRWKRLFTREGRLRDGGVKLLKKVRSRGIHPSIRAEVWPFILGVYDLNSSKDERDISKTQKRKEYERLRRQCQRLLKHSNAHSVLNKVYGTSFEEDDGIIIHDTDSLDSVDIVSARESLSSEEDYLKDTEYANELSGILLEGDDANNNPGRISTRADTSSPNSESSDSDDSSEELEVIQTVPSSEEGRQEEDNISEVTEDTKPKQCAAEDFTTWQRIIRLDALRADLEWLPCSPFGASISQERASHAAEAAALKDYNHLDPCRTFHAARLVAILEAYALYDPEIGYCQGMSDLLSPIISVLTVDHEAFWCFVGFMKKARHNFRLDEMGIRRQLGIVSQIIKSKDSHLYRHLEKLQAEDCFFVYRMVLVMFRRELTFDQTLCLWEVMWADQAAIRAGVGKSAWSRIKHRAPPTDDLLLYAVSASVLQRRKLIIQRYNSMDEILRECNSMAGHLDVWKLLDDAHDLVVTLHNKIKTSSHES